MKMRKALCMFLAISLSTATVTAGVIPGRWEKVEALSPGVSLVVELRGGERLEGVFQSIGPEEIGFIESDGTERRLPRFTVLRIETATVIPDRLRNGVLWGALIGIAGGVASMVAFGESKTNGPVDWSGEDGPGYMIGAALVGGGVGAAVGALIDASIKHPEVLYTARD